MYNFIEGLIANPTIKVLIIFIVLDTIFGIIRAMRTKKVNSAIGIDGIIRKAGMLISMLFFSVIDFIMKIDLIIFIPESLKEVINISKVGIGDLFSLIFIVFELLSVIKNMVLCKIPIPQKLQKFLNKLLKEFTQEIKEGSEEK